MNHQAPIYHIEHAMEVLWLKPDEALPPSSCDTGLLWALLGEAAVRLLGQLVLLDYLKSENSSWTQRFIW